MTEAAEAAGEAPGTSEPHRRSLQHLRFPAIVLGVLALFAIVDFTFAGHPGAPIGSYKLTGSYSYVSAPGLHPPVIKQASNAVSGTPAPGYILTGNFLDLTKPPMDGQSGPLMLDNHLQPVWFRPVPTTSSPPTWTSRPTRASRC